MWELVFGFVILIFYPPMCLDKIAENLLIEIFLKANIYLLHKVINLHINIFIVFHKFGPLF